MAESAFRNLPSVHEVLLEPAIEAVLVRYDRATVVAAVREEIELLRHCFRQGTLPNGEATSYAIASRVELALLHARRPKLMPVINATGILLHTNLGRAPLAEAAAQAAYQAARGYL